MLYFRIVKTERRKNGLWLLLSEQGFEIPNVPVAMIIDMQRIHSKNGLSYVTFSDSGIHDYNADGSLNTEGLDWTPNGLLWAPLSRITAHEGLSELMNHGYVLQNS